MNWIAATSRTILRSAFVKPVWDNVCAIANGDRPVRAARSNEIRVSHRVTSSFYFICFGVLGCYAGIRTVRAGWAKGLISIVMAACLIHLAFDAAFPRTNHADDLAARTLRPQEHAKGGGLSGYFSAKLDDLQADRCVLAHMQDSPLSPLAYIIELHSFLAAYKQMQASQMNGGATLGGLSQLVSRSFGDTAQRLTPEEADAIKGGGNIESLCNAFGKWTEGLAGRPESEQRQVWDAFKSTLDGGQ